MKTMRIRRLAIALTVLMTMATACLGLSFTAFADDITSTAQGKITSLGAPDEVVQGETSSITFGFQIDAHDAAFAKGDTYVFETNLGELFEITGKNTLEVRNADGVLVATVTGAPDRVTVTMEEGAAGETLVTGSVTTPALKAKDVGATVGQPATKTLTLGDQKAGITFTQKNQDERPPVVSQPDFNQLWKNAWASQDSKRMVTSIEVNPYGNIDLYQTLNKSPRTVTTWRNFYVEDVVPEHGQIDLDSMKIYAVVNAVAVAGPDTGAYPEGAVYAQRTGTNRLLIDRVGPDSNRVRIFRISQEPGETKEEFKARILSKDLQWGVYTQIDADGLPTQTLMMNFGDLGDPEENNGIMFNDFLGTQADATISAHQELFGPDGATGGNVVSYYTEFESTFPCVEGEKTFRNHASWEGELITRGSSYQGTKGGNDSGDVTIVNEAGTATATSGAVALTLVDDKTGEPIPNATFKLQTDPDGDGVYTDTTHTAQTDGKGQLRFSSLAQGRYRLVQVDTAPGYSFDNNTYTADASASDDPGTILSNGTFEIWAATTFTVQARATNTHEEYRVAYRFTSDDGELPDAVAALLPTDEQTYRYGDAVDPQSPTQASVAVAPGESWEFQGYRAEGGYDAQQGIITGDVTFIGLWRRVVTPVADELSYHANGGSGEMAPTAGHVGEDVGVAANGFERPGYTFCGWNTQADGSGTAYAAGDAYTLTEGDDVLFAQWTKTSSTEPPAPEPSDPGESDGGNEPEDPSTTNGLPKTGDGASAAGVFAVAGAIVLLAAGVLRRAGGAGSPR